MTAQENGSRTRALVLGGGGAVGVGWQVGMLTGLREAGIDLAGAEEILGTSAGALVGALLSSGRDVTDALAGLAALGQAIDPETLKVGNDAFLSAMRQASLATDTEQLVKEIGRVALDANTMSDDVYLGLFGVLKDVDWPAGFRCTAIDPHTGELVIWGPESGVPVLDAVASSCVVPALFPTVALNGRRYMDGGIISHVNATSVSPSDVVLVLSCHPLESRGAGTHDALVTSLASADAELAQLRESTQLIALEPDFSDMHITPDMMMDPNVAAQAVEIGRRQAAGEAAAIQAAWIA